ncbi:MAG: aquaporin family protein [Propionibacteriaceae bacterium]|nr:aquaporin family protein [Propionibacteriaceae bacterium]
MSLGTVFLSEIVGTCVLIIFGAGVCANLSLSKSKGQGAGWVGIAFGWGLAVFCGVLVSYKSGGHLNPAVTIGVAISQLMDKAKDSSHVACYVSGPSGCLVKVDAASMFTYIGAQLIGAIIGACIVWLAYKKHFDEDAPAGTKLGVFSTGPAIRSYGWNVVTEAIGTFTLVFVILAAGHWGNSNTQTPAGLGWLGALGVAFLIVAIGLSLGGPTGYAINPARDLGPRIAFSFLPIPNKGGADWPYAWVPIVGPIIGAIIAGLLAGVLLPA